MPITTAVRKATQNIYPIESAELKAYRVNEKVAYCVEHGLQVNENTRLKGNKIESSMLSRIYDNSDRLYILENLGIVLLFGRQDTSGISDLTKSADEGGLGFLDWVAAKKASGMTMYGSKLQRDSLFTRPSSSTGTLISILNQTALSSVRVFTGLMPVRFLQTTTRRLFPVHLHTISTGLW